MMGIRLAGTFTALVTPFRDEALKPVDWAAYEKLVAAQLAGGVAGLVPVGTTGESPTLTEAEQSELVSRAVKASRGKALTVAGTGSNSTAHAIHLSKAAEKAGADAVMVVAPYYNKPTQEGLLRHYVAIAASVGVPVIVYNIPGRTGIDILPETMAQIAEQAKNVVAVKEATGNVLRAQELKRRLGDRLSILCGDDALTLPMIASGASGVISVTSNVLPAAVSRATALALEGNFEEARKAHFALLPVHEAMFVESNPAPAKAALALAGMMSDAVREPLAAASARAKEVVRAVLESFERGAR
jgi:4-hydroxy-tetrahydrodipicolinate synthase